jgi:hypothetical protein
MPDYEYTSIIESVQVSGNEVTFHYRMRGERTGRITGPPGQYREDINDLEGREIRFWRPRGEGYFKIDGM